MSWTLVSGINGLPTGDIFDLVSDPGNSNRFYAAVNGHGVDPAGLNSDIHAEAAFRAHLIVVMAKRAVTAALAAQAAA